MFGWFKDKLPEGFREGVRTHAAAFKENAAAMATKAQEGVRTRAAAFGEKAVNTYDTFQKERLPDGITFKYETPTLTADNFKDEVRKLKDNLVIALNNRYGNSYPTIDCLLRFSPSVKVYYRDPTTDIGRMIFGGSRIWTKMDMYTFFYPTFGLTTFDQFQTKVNDFDDFRRRMPGGTVGELQLKIELSNKFDAEQNNEYSTCNRQIRGRGGHRRRSSRKNVRTIKRVKTAKRSRSVKSRKYRNRK